MVAEVQQPGLNGLVTWPLFPDGAGSNINRQLGTCRVHEPHADSARGCDKIIDVLELVAEILHLPEHKRPGEHTVLVTSDECEMLGREVARALAAQKEPLRLDEVAQPG